MTITGQRSGASSRASSNFWGRLANQQGLRLGSLAGIPSRISLAFEAESGKGVGDVEDPRSCNDRHHPLTSVVVIAIMAVLAGAKGRTAIAKQPKIEQGFLQEGLPRP